jgi:hypothetical protein
MQLESALAITLSRSTTTGYPNHQGHKGHKGHKATVPEDLCDLGDLCGAKKSGVSAHQPISPSRVYNPAVREVDTLGGINTGRVILGGLLAGLVINIGETILNVVVLAQAMEDLLRARNLPVVGGSAIGGFVFFAFLLGIATVWLYAAIRPRFGANVKTAVVAGLFVWYFAYFYAASATVLMGIYPTHIAAIGVVWGLVEIVLASIAGAWLYTE